MYDFFLLPPLLIFLIMQVYFFIENFIPQTYIYTCMYIHTYVYETHTYTYINVYNYTDTVSCSKLIDLKHFSSGKSYKVFLEERSMHNS